VSEASACQRLRGHLAELRLTAAAEALPAEPGHAAANNASHTAFLERLLAIEVTATTARRQASLARFACLPAPWRLTDFDFDAQPSVDRKLVSELGTLRFLDDATNILLIGPPGAGKTCSPPDSATPPSPPATAPTTPPPPTWSPAATAPRSKAAGPPPCGSSPGPASS
jgi:hypothetical protein